MKPKKLDRLKKQAKKERYELLTLANKYSPYGSPTQKCGLVPISNRVSVIRGENGHYYGGLYTCHSAWGCPYCSIRKMREKGRILAAMHWAISEPVIPTMITYTVQHGRADSLASTLDILKNANRVTRSGSRRKRYYDMSLGYVNSTEITYSKYEPKDPLFNGWHPHQHELNYFYVGVDQETIEKNIIGPYHDALVKSGKVVRNITVKIDRWDHDTDYLLKGNQLACELTAIDQKTRSTNVLDIMKKMPSSQFYHARYLEFLKATYRRKVINLSSSLRPLYAKAADKIAAAESEESKDDEVVFSMSNEEWGNVVKQGTRWELIANLD